MEEIILRPSIGREINLIMSQLRPIHSAEEVLKVCKNVYEDVEYEIELTSDIGKCSITVYINGEEQESYLYGNKIVFGDDNKKIFANIYGFAQIVLCIRKINSEQLFYSEYVSVLIRASDKNKSVSMMLKYIYANMEDYLFHEMNKPEIGKEEITDDFWAQILFLEEVANVYEGNYGYFKANSRYKLDKKEVLDRTEKLQHIDAKTIQYMVRHPEYLDRSVIGINYGSQTYLPRKTLMTQNVISYDIYENKIVVSFLNQMFLVIEDLKSNVQRFIDSGSVDENADNGYIVSSFIIYENALELLREFLQRILVLEDKYRQLLMSYKRILDVKYSNSFEMPEPTAIFMNVPQYNRVYSCIMKWNQHNAYDFEKEQMMMNFFNAPEIFETYSLIKLINYIKESGYILKKTKQVHYPKRSHWLYKQKNYNNTYIFENESSSITLYYEPFIYDEDSRSVNGIGLFRNNSVSLNNKTDEEYRGHYYVPDYLLKYSDENKENYIICDAKFSSKMRVKHKIIPYLAYKYITSISTIDESDSLKGLFVFYGIVDNYAMNESFYDAKIESAKDIIPYIKLVPISEEISYTYQENNVFDILQKLMG